MRTSTHTIVMLEVPQVIHEHIASQLRAAGYTHVFLDDNVIDMTGIGLAIAPEPE